MFLEQPDLLNPAEVAQLTQLAASIKFVDGRVSNPHNVTKTNLQGDISDSRHAEASATVLAALARSRPFQDFAMPRTEERKSALQSSTEPSVRKTMKQRLPMNQTTPRGKAKAGPSFMPP